MIHVDTSDDMGKTLIHVTLRQGDDWSDPIHEWITRDEAKGLAKGLISVLWPNILEHLEVLNDEAQALRPKAKSLECPASGLSPSNTHNT